MPIVSLDVFSAVASRKDRPFDYLIIGGGTTGLVIANRLAQYDPNVIVGVIEAGSYYPPGTSDFIDVPGLFGHSLGDSSLNWAVETEPVQGADNRKVVIARGRGLGGSTLINFMTHTRPAKGEYDALESTFKNQGWNWDSLLECMKKGEHFIVQKEDVPTGSFVHSRDLSFHGTQGPIVYSNPPRWPPHSTTVDSTGQTTLNLPELGMEMMGKHGIPENPSPTNGNIIGYTKTFMAIDPTSGNRSSAASGYLEPILETAVNLYVLTDALVTRVLFDRLRNGLPKAVGVELRVEGLDKLVEIRNVRRDIILAAGALQTPVILESSGIGDPEILKQCGIECVVGLPGVGNNLQNHPAVHVAVEVDSKFPSLDMMFDPVEKEKQEKLYREKKEGLLATGLGFGVCFVPLHDISRISKTSSKEFIAKVKDETEKYIDLMHLSKEVRQGYEIQYQLQLDQLNDPDQAHIEFLVIPGELEHPDFTGKRRTMTFSAIITHPFSRGSIHHHHHNGSKIDGGFLSHPADRTLFLNALVCIIRFFRTQPLKNAIKNWIYPIDLSTIDVDEALRDTDDNVELRNQLERILDEHISKNMVAMNHPVGTAAMMAREEGGVVDEELKVYGVEGLRVADLSVLPLHIASHTVSVAFAIGEKASDIIIKAHNSG
ncbi:hypothetical protein AGABI2DRAFT_120938 [Agaricus bisporus var. bisporus H97]|uniref:hypothetical protein n=1 Tax=Agaricus bisporus var. bisporus (strain H97 / ATCC MYA-4626 / FGSC 10389) TaxID=936046 RepID=UPI00029F7439|nr:hypothetical protein AGABI2DRAFT_120938 [Agaricus bisporus var. bisporus H97]EKV44843.1 hypothetical protein AGABI2DRAFT_120938 [Agaricus bisporus var. bisporus H97]